MVKKIFLFHFLVIFLNANTFEQNCLKCHDNEFQLSMFMKKYTLKYSSEKRIKKALNEYLKNPTHEKSILPLGYLKKFGIKEKSFLKDEELEKMIEIYYNRYNIKSKIY